VPVVISGGIWLKIKILLLSLSCCGLFPASLSYADSLEIREWLVPWKETVPRDPFVDEGGRVWFVGQAGNYIGNLSPEDGLFNRYDLPPGSGPHNLIVDGDRNIWFAANRKRYIGKLSPSSGQISQFEMPERKAKDPHTLVFDQAGDIWFTVQKGNFIGKLSTANGTIQLIQLASKKQRPYGIIVDRDNMPWAAAFGSNKLLQVFPATMTVAEIALPDTKSRPRRLVSTSNGDIWYTDFELGRLGRYRPLSNEFSEWSMPGGSNSQPYGMAVDRNDRIWIVETGSERNRFVGFDSASESFLNETDIPSGGGSVRNMYYYEAAGEVWFGTDTNYIGRAKVH
jgi:virginiamycin B lyase